MSNGQELLRFALISGIVGFAVFCVSYAFVVWRKRNPLHGSPSFRLSIGIGMAGLAGLAILWATRELAPRDGVIEGKDLFVVHSRGDAGIIEVSEDEAVRKGDVLAEFVPPAMEAQLSVLDNRIAEAQSRVDSLKHRSLPLDPLLVQRQVQVRTELDRAR
jgi:multidrug efflux pump subunit AcrA (membrane-fusion protein)